MTVAYDGSAASRRTLALAAQLARGKGDGLTVLLLADDSEQATVLHAQAEGWLEEQGSRVRFRSLVDADVPRLAHAARRIESGYKIVYKPRSLAVENHFGESMGWLDERGSLRESLRMPRVLDRGSHGWAEFVFKQDCGPMRLLIPGAHIIAPFLAAAVGRVSMFTSGT